MKGKVYVLDCTLRDGGWALKEKNNKKICFSEEMRVSIVRNLTDVAIDIIELGSVGVSKNSKREYAFFTDIYEASELIRVNQSKKQVFSVFFTGPDIPIGLLPDWNESLCQIIRLSVRYSELKKSLEYCKELCKKGYKVSIQPIVTVRYTDKELHDIIDAANNMNAYSVYLVDSYGSMYGDDVRRMFGKFNKGLKKNIKIGFHVHNNMDFASANIISLLAQNGVRDIIIDSCCMGMGQGAGNLQTEVILNYLNKNNDGKYEFKPILKVLDLISDFWTDNLWGYSIAAMIPAIYNAAYRYGIALRNNYNYSYEDIYCALENISDDMRYRYTKENLEKIIKEYGGIKE